MKKKRSRFRRLTPVQIIFLVATVLILAASAVLLVYSDWRYDEEVRKHRETHKAAPAERPPPSAPDR